MSAITRRWSSCCPTKSLNAQTVARESSVMVAEIHGLMITHVPRACILTLGQLKTRTAIVHPDSMGDRVPVASRIDLFKITKDVGEDKIMKYKVVETSTGRVVQSGDTVTNFRHERLGHE